VVVAGALLVLVIPIVIFAISKGEWSPTVGEVVAKHRADYLVLGETLKRISRKLPPTGRVP
jgi:hypothetical protein